MGSCAGSSSARHPERPSHPRGAPPIGTTVSNRAIDAWLPKSILALRQYDRRTFTSDLFAGITVGLVALPLAMAFAISSGVPPQAGIYTAVVAGFIISALAAHALRSEVRPARSLWSGVASS